MPVNPVITSRWRSGKHVGAFKPAQTVRVQRGYMQRQFGEFTMLDGSHQDFGFVSHGKHNADPWHGVWVDTGPWIDLPNVSSVDTDQQLSVEGIGDPEVATILIENVVAEEINGIAGIFHRIRRGFLAPLRGYRHKGRPHDRDAISNEWFDVLNSGYRIEVKQGYGDAIESTFMGLIDDCDTRSSPDQITITARNMGALLTDQRLFGWNKARDIPAPIVFADRAKAEKETHAGGHAAASSTDASHRPQAVLEEGSKTYWLSQGSVGPDWTEWVQIRLPKGRYTHFFVRPEYAGMEMYLSVFVHGAGNTIDGAPVAEGWVDTGLGDVPGDNGGFPFVKHWGSVDDQGMKRKLPFELHCNDNTILRISFRNLHHVTTKGDYRAKVSRLLGYRQALDAKVKSKNWILVDDASDVVKWILMWAGFHEWEVHPMGVSLREPMVFHQGDYMIDPIKHMVDQGNFVFFVDRPSSDPDSIGVPRFVKNKVTEPAHKLQEVRDTDLLTGLESKFTKEPLAFIIRVRGALRKPSKGGKALGEDKDTRVMATYFPPWSGAHRSIDTDRYQPHYPFADRLAGLRKHVTHYDNTIGTEDEALMACLLIAVQEALASFQATIQVPGYPGFRLNEAISVVDTPSGSNSRLWIGNRHSTFTTGPDGAWTMSLAGAMIDTPDILALVIDYLYLLRRTTVRLEK